MLTEIAAYLAANGVGTVGTNLFKGEMPETPNKCIAIKQYAGEPPDLVGDIVNPGLQVLVRDPDFATAETSAWAIHDLLHGLANTTLSGKWYLLIRAVQNPFELNWDSKNRVTFAQNFIVKKAR